MQNYPERVTFPHLQFGTEEVKALEIEVKNLNPTSDPPQK
jgi:hypothetical protein